MPRLFLLPLVGRGRGGGFSEAEPSSPARRTKRMSNPIIIVGAAGGIGSALSRRLAAQGAKLHLIGRNADKLQALAQETNATSTVVDVMDRAALEAAVKAAGPAAQDPDTALA